MLIWQFRWLTRTYASQFKSCRSFAVKSDNASISRAGATSKRATPMSMMPNFRIYGAERSRVKVDEMSDMPGHFKALMSITNRLPLLGVLGGPGGLLESYRERTAMQRANRDKIFGEEIFSRTRSFLMQHERWTFGSMLAYQRMLLDLLGAYSWRRRFSADDPSVQHLEKELKVLEAMTPIELASNHKRVFTTEAINLIAEKAGCSKSFVDRVLAEHDQLRGDRRWYMILEQFGKPLPKSFEDRQYMAEYDRPLSETELEMRDEMIKDHERKQRGRKRKFVRHIYFRQPTCGGNRWSGRVPRWYPQNFFVSSYAALRLRGVGSGQGGDRGRPWGRLAKFTK